MAVTTSYGFGFVESLDEGNPASNADAVSLANGGVAVSGDHAGHTDVTIFGAEGDFTGSALILTGTQSAITQLSNGNVVILGDGGTDMFFSILDGTTGASVLVNQSIGESGPDVLDPEVAGLTGGGFVVAIQDFFGGTDNDVDLRIYDNDGNLLNNFAVDSSGANDQNPSVAGLADGGFAVAWHRNVGSSNELWYAVYEANGTVRLAPTMLDNIGTVNRNASAVALDNGGFAIAYEDNGWDGDNDITLARFTAAGAFVDWDDIANSAAGDFTPSATVLSNGMIVVGTINDNFGHNDPIWTLVDQNTGGILAQSSTGTTHNDFSPSVAAMLLGQAATFHTDATTGDVVGQTLQAQRFSNSDAASDTITGDDLQDFINGGAGDDTIRGGFNADILNGDEGNDTFVYATGEQAGNNNTVDAINGGADFDRILAESDVDLSAVGITAIEEIEFSNLTALDNTITIAAGQIGAGLATNLLVDGNESGTVDTLRIEMLGDTAVDLSLFTFQNFVSGAPENDRLRIQGDGDDETIVGSSVRDDVAGGSGNDDIKGGGGDDRLNGGNDDDTLQGGLGDDTLDGGATGSDTADYSDAVGGVTVGLNVAGAQAVGGGLGSDTLSSIDNLTGGSGGDTFTGNGSANTLRGAGGTDTLVGSAGNDLLDGGSGNDAMNGGNGDDTFVVSSLGDTVTEAAGAGTGSDTVQTGIAYTLGANLERLKLTSAAAIDGTGNGGGNFIDGNNAANTLTGLGGADRLDGKGGADTMIGGTGNEIYYIDNAGDSISETGGAGDIDLVRSTLAINLTTIANVENATVTSAANVGITGSNAANILTGGNGANTITGGGGADTIRGNFGADTMNGGGAADTFLWLGLNESNGASQDTISGFVSGTDKLDFIAIDANATVGGNQNFVLDINASFSAGEFRLTDLGADLLLEGNTDNDANAEISVLFTNINSLAAADFL